MRSSKTRKRLFQRPMEVIPEATPQKGKTPFSASPLASTTPPSVRKRSIAILPATRTRPLVMLRSLPALKNNTTGSGNIALGDGAGYRVTTAHHVIAIGTPGANVSLSCFIGSIRGIATANADAIPVLIDSAGQLGTLSSSRRFKKEIKTTDRASESILALKPVTFHYKGDAKDTPQFGLIAEEVAEVNPDLVVRDEKGEIYTVRYDAVNAMLLNEFLKEHRKVEEQQATITELKSTEAQQQKDLQATVAHQQKQIEALSAGLQKVSAQLELSKAAPQTVLNRQ